MSGAVVAVVEDDTALCELLRDILTDESYAVVCANSGSDALALIRQHRPNVLLLDINLASTIDGWSVVELLRANPTTADLPIIISTAESNFLHDNARKLRVLRCDFLAKPFEIDELLDCVERAINPPTLEATA